jgi:very-short-patch-repair endonuclease
MMGMDSEGTGIEPVPSLPPLPGPPPQGGRERRLEPHPSSTPSPLAGEGGARRAAVGGRGRALARAREMRKHPTEAERRLWSLLRAKRLGGWKWKRQQKLGRYIVDFVCLEARLIVEADGSQHIGSAYDATRDAWIKAQGFTILRLYNNDILGNPEAVATAILVSLQAAAGASSPAARSPSPLPSPTRGEGVQDGTLHG